VDGQPVDQRCEVGALQPVGDWRSVLSLPLIGCSERAVDAVGAGRRPRSCRERCECLPERLGRDDPPDDLASAEIKVRRRRRVARDSLCVVEVEVVVRALAADRHRV
jgi:hypothetical protein